MTSMQGLTLLFLVSLAPSISAQPLTQQDKEQAHLAISQAHQAGDFKRAQELAADYLQKEKAFTPITSSNVGWRKLFGKNSSPEQAETQYLLASSLMELHDWPEAARWFSSVAQAHPKGELYSSARYRQGECLFNQGRYQDALQVFQRLSLSNHDAFLDEAIQEAAVLCQERLSPSPGSAGPGAGLPAIAFQKHYMETHPEEPASPLRALLVADLFYDLGQYSVALEHYQNLLTQGTEPFYSQYMMGLSLYQNKEHMKSLTVFQNLLQKSEASPYADQVKMMEAECYFRMNHGPDAADRFLALVVSSQTMISQEARFKRALTLAQMGFYERALSELSQEERSEDRLELLEGFCRLQMGDQAGALSQFQDLVDLATDPDVLDKALFLAAKIHTEKKDFGALVTQYQNILRSARAGVKPDPKRPPSLWRPRAYLLLAEAYYALERYSDAMAVYQAISDSYPSTILAAQSLSGAAACLAQLGNQGQSRKVLERLAKNYGGHREVLVSSDLMTAQAYFNEGKFNEALGFYDKLIAAHPQDKRLARALHEKGLTLARLEHYSQAISVWSEVAARFPGDPMAWKALDQCSRTAFGLGHYDQAIGFNRRLTQAPDVELAKEAYLRTAQCHYNARSYQETIKAYEAYLAAYPNDARQQEVYEGIQAAYFQWAGQDKNPEAVLNELARRFSATKLAGEAYWKLGASAYEKKQFAKASEYFQRVVSQYPHADSAKPALYYLAESQYESNRLDEAIITYKTFVTSFPGDELIPGAQFHLANAHFKKGNLEESIVEYQVLVDSSPLSEQAPSALLNLALVHQKLNQFPQAGLAYRRFIKQYPDKPERDFAAFQTGLMAQEMEDWGQALLFYQTAAPSREVPAMERLYRIAECQTQLGQLDQALKIYSEILQGTRDPQVKAALQFKINQLTRGVR